MNTVVRPASLITKYIAFITDQLSSGTEPASVHTKTDVRVRILYNVFVCIMTARVGVVISRAREIRGLSQ